MSRAAHEADVLAMIRALPDSLKFHCMLKALTEVATPIGYLWALHELGYDGTVPCVPDLLAAAARLRALVLDILDGKTTPKDATLDDVTAAINRAGGGS